MTLPGRMRCTAQEIIDAYQRTGSVWRAGKELGIPGQTVHKKLVALGYPLAARHWSDDEIGELRALVNHMTLSEVAERLGRPYYGVAMKVSRLGLGSHFGNRQPKKLPRGAGYDKASCAKYIRAIDASGSTVHQFARRQGLGVEGLCQALERHFLDWWTEYRRAHSDLPEAACPYCGRVFIPTNKKQLFCSRKCGNDSRIDTAYFGGQRRRTIGLVEGVCQLCLQEKSKGLSSHHLLGKANDPDNGALIALCQGCHQIVGILAGRKFLDEPEGWERLIALARFRRLGDQQPKGFDVYVEIEVWGDDDLQEFLADADGEVVL